MASFAGADGESPAEYSPAVREYSSMNTYRGNGSAENTLYSSALFRKNNPDDLEYLSAMETGNLPSDVGALNAGSAPATDVPKVDYGGVVYRIGIDTP